MSRPLAGNRPAQAAVAALVLLGLLGAALVLAHGGFTTSPKRGGSPTFVPMPQAWVVAGVLHAMSLLGVLALVRLRHRAAVAAVMAAAVHAAVLGALVLVLRSG